MTDWILGADPEVFLMKGKTFYNAHDALGSIIKGNKEQPEPTQYGGIQVDGMAVEFNTHPVNNIKDLLGYVDAALDDIKKRFKGMTILEHPTMEFSSKEWALQARQSKVIGCDQAYIPQYLGSDCYSKLPVTGYDFEDSEQKYRFAGGHIHLGWTDREEVEDPVHISRCAYVAEHMRYILAGFETYSKRSMYHRLREFRVKPYGVELRGPSNHWLFFDKTKQKKFFASVLAGMDMIVDNKAPSQNQRMFEKKRNQRYAAA